MENVENVNPTITETISDTGDEHRMKITKETVDGIEEFIDCARRRILPYNELAFRTIINVIELTLIRGEFGNVAGGYNVAPPEVTPEESASADEVVREIMSNGVLDDVEIIERARRGIDVDD